MQKLPVYEVNGFDGVDTDHTLYVFRVGVTLTHPLQIESVECIGYLDIPDEYSVTFTKDDTCLELLHKRSGRQDSIKAGDFRQSDIRYKNFGYYPVGVFHSF
ncbi:MAG: hypothetical protein LBB34_00555 [Holosporales bacterium]|jgi:hypothetical protein|nr:hypothetical protein [Holosporales bacterium]